MQTLWAKVFPSIKYLIQSGVLMFDAWSWNNASGVTGRTYQSGDVYCLEVNVTTTNGQGINFRTPVIETDELSKMQIDFTGITNSAYSSIIKILNQEGETLLTDNVTVTGIIRKIYDIPRTNIILQITVSAANGINTLKISNILLS